MKTRLMVKCGVSLGVAVLVAAAVAAAEFVSPQEKAPANGAAAVFEKSFANRGAVRRATWDVTAQGVFEAFANGRRVGNDFLKPGVTECGKCRHVYSYDVTGLLDRRAGATNVLSATVTPGWWCDQMMRPPAKVSDWQRGNKREWQLGKEIAFRGELRLEFDDGSAQTVGTDESWLAAYTGPLVSAGIYEGEVYDARRRVEGLKGVRRNTEFAGELRPAAAKIALREDLVLTPREAYVVKGVEGASKDAFGVAKVIRRYADGEDVRLEPGEMLVIDFGQNCSAVPSFEVTGEAGSELKIRASEMLNESHGEKSRGNDGPAGTPYLAALRSAYAGIHYTLKDGRQSYMPRYTYFGYRYLGVTATRTVAFARWRSTPVSSVTREMERGRIVTGNARVNRLIANIRWGLLSNYLSSPTDCPQRDERMGWTADTQVFMNSAAYFADTSEFLGKYLADLRDAQRASGCYMCFVPNVHHTFPPWASAGWTDAGVIMPYRLWKWYGDRRFVDESWESMVRYMDFLEGNAEPYRINHGDWLTFEHHKKNAGDAMDRRQVKALNAYFRVWMAMLMREMAAATGRGAAERHYAEEEAKLRQAFAAAYVGPDGTIKDEYKGQCNDLYMLKLGLCGGAAAVEATKRDLIANIKACGNRLQTGFLGTAILMPTLTFEANAPELAYSLLLQDAFPSWLYSVDQGATTVWERWNGYTKEKGFGPVGMNSFNHYAYGCVAEWLFAAAAGIRQPKGAVGWKRFLLAPIPDKRLGSVDASFISPEGEIRSSWKYEEDGKWTWTFAVPKGTLAIVSAPGIPEREYGPGEWSVTSNLASRPDVRVTDSVNVGARPVRLPQGAETFEVVRPCAHGGAVVNAADFGFSATNDLNAAAVMRALDFCRRTKASRLVLAPGTYNCFDPDHGLVVADMEDFTLDGAGATLVFRRPTRRLAATSVRVPHDSSLLVTNCQRCVVGNFSIDWDWKNDPLCDVGVVVATHVDEAENGSYFDLELPDWPQGHPWYGRPMPIQTMTPINAERTRLTAETPSRLLFGLTEGHFGTKMAWLSPHAVRVWPGVREPGQYAAPVNDHYYGAAINRRTVAQMRKGVLYRVFHYYYGKNGITMHSGRHVTVENVNVLGCFGMPIVVDGAQEYGEFRKVVVEPVPGRPCTGTSDGCHVARSKGHIKFIDCVISFQNDDGLNIHDCFTLGVPDGPRRIRVTNVRGPEYLGAQPGNELELLAPNFRTLGWKGHLLATEGDCLVVDRDLPPLAGEHFLVFDNTFQSDHIVMRGCTFHDTHFREIVQPKHVTVEDCRFIRTGSGFKMGSAHSREFWCEGRGSRDIVIRRCTFEHDCTLADWSHAALPVFETYVRFPRPKPYPPGNNVFTMEPPAGFDIAFHGDILVEKCTITDPSGPLFVGNPVSNLIFRDNEIVLTGARRIDKTTGSFAFGAARHIFITGNRYFVAPSLGQFEPPVKGDVSGLTVYGNTVQAIPSASWRKEADLL